MGKLKTIQEIEKKLFLQPLPDVIAKLNYIRRLERTWQLIERDYADPDLGLEIAAKASGVNKNHLNALFRQRTKPHILSVSNSLSDVKSYNYDEYQEL